MWNEKYICHHCVEDKYVKQQIRNNGNVQQNCSYCYRKRRNVGLDVIAEMMNDVFEYYYDIHEDIYDTGRGDNAQDIICGELGVEEDAAEDIYNCLIDECTSYYDYQESRYNDDFIYRQRDFSAGELDYLWEQVTHELITKNRYFNRKANDFLDNLFRDIEELKTQKRSSPIKTIPEDDCLFRARVFEDREEVEKALEHPERNFGPPPAVMARQGRMNAHGISVFYGATSVELAIAEVRPPVGSIVVTAPFVPLRELRVLDISALSSLSFGTGSKFDSRTRKTDERAVFFKTLSRKLTLPVFGKRQDSAYLITQVISDYLSDSDKFKLDGVSFKSTQVSAASKETSKGYNVVLFNKSSRVKHAEDKNRRYKVELYEYVEDGLYAFSPVLQLIAEEPRKPRFISSSSVVSVASCTLEIDTEKMTYHKITGVKYETNKTEITRAGDIIKPSPPESFDDLTDF